MTITWLLLMQPIAVAKPKQRNRFDVPRAKKYIGWLNLNIRLTLPLLRSLILIINRPNEPQQSSFVDTGH